jgi:hypothetical protein
LEVRRNKFICLVKNEEPTSIQPNDPFVRQIK